MPADAVQVLRMKQLLQNYALSVGLRINFDKSTLVPINLDTVSADHIATTLGCKLG